MTVKERLAKLVESLPEEEAEKILHFAETLEDAGIIDERERNSGFSTEFLKTFGAWSDDPRSTEEVIDEIYRSRVFSNRDVSL
jgi:hypothetical protein